MFNLFVLPTIAGFLLSAFFLAKSKLKDYRKLIVSSFILVSSIALALLLFGDSNFAFAAALISPLGLLVVSLSLLYGHEKEFFIFYLVAFAVSLIASLFYNPEYLHRVSSYFLSLASILILIYIYHKTSEKKILVLSLSVLLFVLAGYSIKVNWSYAPLMLVLAMVVFALPFVKKD